MGLVPEAPTGVRRVIRFFILIVFALPLTAAAQDWPARAGESIGYLHEYEGAGGWVGRTIVGRATGEIWSDAEAVAALAERAGIDVSSVMYEHRSAHIAGVFGVEDSDAPSAFRYAVFVSAEPRPGGSHRLHRTWFRFGSPEDGRGLAVIMPGMLGTPHPIIDRLEQTLQREGWATLRMLVPPSRTTEHLPVAIDVDDAGETIRQLAAELAQRTAECAYAVEAVLGWVDSMGLPLVDKPRVIIGMSGTGMMLPAVVARNEGEFAAGVIIGSGANAFKILRETSYADMLDAVRVTWSTRRPTAEALAELDELYLSHAKLDAYAMAPLVAGTPVLLLDGSKDRAVPAATGDLLASRLSEPTRWSKPVGHELLFAGLALWIPDMLDWLDERVAESAE